MSAESGAPTGRSPAAACMRRSSALGMSATYHPGRRRSRASSCARRPCTAARSRTASVGARSTASVGRNEVGEEEEGEGDALPPRAWLVSLVFVRTRSASSPPRGGTLARGEVLLRGDELVQDAVVAGLALVLEALVVRRVAHVHGGGEGHLHRGRAGAIARAAAKHRGRALELPAPVRELDEAKVLAEGVRRAARAGRGASRTATAWARPPRSPLSSGAGVPRQRRRMATTNRPRRTLEARAGETGRRANARGVRAARRALASAEAPREVPRREPRGTTSLPERGGRGARASEISTRRARAWRRAGVRGFIVRGRGVKRRASRLMP